MMRSEDGSKELSSKDGSIGEVRRADSRGGLRHAVVLRDPNRKDGVRSMNNRRMRKAVGLPDNKVGSRLTIMRCNSSTIIDQLLIRKG